MKLHDKLDDECGIKEDEQKRESLKSARKVNPSRVRARFKYL
jgi:hypothetical protein